jgi:hypothetical protein
VYGWIWRKLPFGIPGKIMGSLILLGAVCAALWFWVFPAIDPILPFNDVQVTAPSNQPSAPASPSGHGNNLPGN